MLSQTKKTCRVLKGEIFCQEPWTGHNFEGDPLRCFLLLSSKIRSLSCKNSKWLAIRMSYFFFFSFCLLYVFAFQFLFSSLRNFQCWSKLCIVPSGPNKGSCRHYWGLTAPFALHLNTSNVPQEKTLSCLFLEAPHQLLCFWGTCHAAKKNQIECKQTFIWQGFEIIHGSMLDTC